MNKPQNPPLPVADSWLNSVTRSAPEADRYNSLQSERVLRPAKDWKKTPHRFGMFVTSLLLLCTPILATAQHWHNPQSAFKQSAHSYIHGEKEEAKELVNKALEKFPNDEALMRLKQLLEQQENQDQQQQQENQDQQNQEQEQNQNQESQQDQSSDNGDSEEQSQENSEENQDEGSENSEEESEQSESEQNGEEESESADEEEPQPQASPQEENEEDEGEEEQAQPQSGQENQEEGEEQNSEEQQTIGVMTREQARLLLDSMKSQEKKLPVSAYRKKKDNKEKTNQNKDW